MDNEFKLEGYIFNVSVPLCKGQNKSTGSYKITLPKEQLNRKGIFLKQGDFVEINGIIKKIEKPEKPKIKK